VPTASLSSGAVFASNRDMDPLRSIPKLETLVRKTRPELAVARGTGIERWPRILDWGARVKLTTRQFAKGRVQGVA